MMQAIVSLCQDAFICQVKDWKRATRRYRTGMAAVLRSGYDLVAPTGLVMMK